MSYFITYRAHRSNKLVTKRFDNLNDGVMHIQRKANKNGTPYRVRISGAHPTLKESFFALITPE